MKKKYSLSEQDRELPKTQKDKKIKQVVSFFESRDYKCYGKNKNKKSNGYDLLITKNDKFQTVEIKSLTYSSRSFRFNLLDTQKSSDLLAVVTKNGTVFVYPMSLFKNKKSTISLGSMIGDM